MDWNNPFVQGWQCPICKRVYSPTTPMCMYCGGEQKTFVTTDIGTSIDIGDYELVRKTKKQ